MTEEIGDCLEGRPTSSSSHFGEVDTFPSNTPARMVLPDVDELITSRNGPASSGSVEMSNKQKLTAAFDKGYDQGVVVGKREAEEELRQQVLELETRIKESNSLISQLKKLLADGYEVKSSELAKFAFEIAKAVIWIDPIIGENRLESILIHTFQEMPVEMDLHVRVHPMHGDFVRELIDRIEEVNSLRAVVVNDDSIEPGGALIECGPTSIDLQITTAANRVKEAISELSGVER